MKFSKYISKAVTQVMALFQKQRSWLSNKVTTICGDIMVWSQGEPAASADTARSGRQVRRNQSAVCVSHNVPSDILIYSKISLCKKYMNKYGNNKITYYSRKQNGSVSSDKWLFPHRNIRIFFLKHLTLICNTTILCIY